MPLATEGTTATRSAERGRIHREVFHVRSLINSIAFSSLFLGTAFLALNPDWFDRPVANTIKDIIRDHQFSNGLMVGVAYPTLEGVVVLSLLWYCWFSDLTVESRARILSSAVAAVFAGFIAHLLRAAPFLNVTRFPSERAAMFAALAIAVFLLRPKLGWFALGWTLVVQICRIFLEFHAPTEIIGSFCLGAALVWLFQMRWGAELGLRLIGWEAGSASTFYMCAFFASYQMSTAFQDLRELASQFLDF